MEHISKGIANSMENVWRTKHMASSETCEMAIFAGTSMIRGGVNVLKRTLASAPESAVTVEASYVVRETEAAIAQLEKWSEENSERLNLKPEIEVAI